MTYADDALQSAVDLSVKHIGDRLLPDKAIDVIDEAGARQRLLPEGTRKELIDVEEIETIVAKMARIPAKQVSSSDKDVLQHLERNLMLVTALNRHIGYDLAAQIAKRAHHEGLTLREAALASGHVAPEDYDRWIDPLEMTRPG